MNSATDICPLMRLPRCLKGIVREVGLLPGSIMSVKLSWDLILLLVFVENSPR
jgi:hypothetical protein